MHILVVALMGTYRAKAFAEFVEGIRDEDEYRALGLMVESVTAARYWLKKATVYEL
jgi:hypothetical protein